jgi:hypothetical protein
VERGILFGDYFAVNAGLPVSPAHLVPEEDWDMESGESPAPPPSEGEITSKKSSQNPQLDEAANHQQLVPRFHFTTIFNLESSRHLGEVLAGIGLENYGCQV